jgi:serine/threonine protein kinase
MFSKKVVINGVSYTEKKLIGEGAFAYVYHMKAYSPMRLADAGGATDKTKQQYAVKKLLCQTPEQRNDALKEIEVLKTVDHEFVMPYVDSESNQTEVYIVMPLCDLGTLQQFVTRGVFPFQSGIVYNSTGSALDTAIKDGLPRVLLQTVTGLLALHRAGFRHADLKPDNILLQFLPSAEVKPLITDFGSATPIRQVVQSKADRLNLQEYAASYSTASYRAPELWEASDQTLSNDGKLVVDGKADVWSFGCIIYALLYASTPFESAAQGLSTLAIQSGTYKKPSLPCTASKAQTSTFLMYNQLIQECLEVQTEARVDAQGLYVKMKDFDSASSGTALVEVLTLLGQQTALPPPIPPAAATVVVAAAPTLPAAAPKVVATLADIAPTTCTPSATSDNFANFANFPAGGQVEQSKEVVLTAAALSDDDFGDFADFDSVTIAPVAPAPVATAAAKGVPAAVRTVPVPISTDSTFLSDVLLSGYEKAGGADGLLFCSRVFVRRTTGFLRKTVSRKPVCIFMVMCTVLMI